MSEVINPKIVFYSAGAGSGKTYKLTELLHHGFTADGVRPSGVIATTFTKKAAAELRERVREHLLQQGDFERASAMGEARIGTVNSVCGQLLTRFAFEAGMPADQLVLEEGQAGMLLGKAVDSVIEPEKLRELLSLARRLGLEDDWKSALQNLVNQIRSNDIRLSKVAGFANENADDLLKHFPKPVSGDLSLQLRSAIHLALPKVEAVAESGNKKNTQRYLDLLKDFSRKLEEGSIGWGEWVKLGKEKPEVGLLPTIEPIADLAMRVAEHPSLQQDIRRYLVLMYELAVNALEVYSHLKQEIGALDFTDQEHKLLELLDHPEVTAVLSDEIDLLMVDEFQDTSPIQLTLFLKLTRFARKVYWVGDIKQAIYGFRGSDTELMQKILEVLPQLDGIKDVLPSSWRSRSELVHVVNDVFSRAFANTLGREDVVLEPKRLDPLPGAALENWVLEGKNRDEEDSALAAGVRDLIGSQYQVFDKASKKLRPARYSDVAILSRSNDAVKSIAAALSVQGIPVAVAQSGLMATPESVLTLACLRRLNDPGDTIATAEIVSLVDCTEPEVWVADRLRYLQSGGHKNLWLEEAILGHPVHPILETIAQLRSALPVLAPREALGNIVAACQIPQVVLQWCRNPDRARVRLANIEALLELAEQYEDLCRNEQHAASVSGLILWLEDIAANDQDMLAEPAINAVKVLTHHASKGLEWPIVLLTDLAASVRDNLWSISARSGAEFDVQAPLKDRFIRYWPWPFGAQKMVPVAETIGQTEVAKAFKAAAIEEAKRLLYVSMTRARDLMILVRTTRKISGEWLESVDSPWLLNEPESDGITLPSGKFLSAIYKQIPPAALSEELPIENNVPLFWRERPMANHSFLNQTFNPSAAIVLHGGEAIEQCRIGERIALHGGGDKSVVGTAIHACIAFMFGDFSAKPEISDIEAILSGFAVQDQLSAVALHQQITAFVEWVETRWPVAIPKAELPIQSIIQTGQILNGRIDLLLELEEGWILIDHKSSQLASDHWTNLAKDYSGQLEGYADAILRASGKPVLESWLYLPVAGGAVRING
ncbi:UvrD-helicase domain-containing protein [Candidatus Nitrotoga fabula]|uniref:DNA 3'-5' helicase n=1 Tax=Candidatus Nitrotoga fabula TaxID=2182327 RepID=A0A916F9Y9_9PROT|nr:UvrD-helicase domain-containing protein [Candidatus Nitrotoga fabula]CAE6723244.1 DNA helicase [Candidatus Nitrotoga fabula]